MHFDAVQMRFGFTLSCFDRLNRDDLKEHRRDDHERSVWMEIASATLIRELILLFVCAELN